MKKTVALVASGLLVILLLYLLLSPIFFPKITIERTTIGIKDSDIKKYSLPDSAIILDKTKGFIHLKTTNTTYRSIFLKVNQKLDIPLESRLKGRMNLYFFIRKLSDTTDPLHLHIYKNKDGTSTLLHQIKHITKFRTINQEISLEKNEKISIRLSGNSELLITPPILFKNVINRKRFLVFLISADTLRADHLGVYGYKKPISKNITRFADDSVIFNHCYAQSSWTLPSHISLFTACNVLNHGVYNKKHKLSSKVPFLTENLTRNYFNFSFNGNFFVNYRYGYYRGFDFYVSEKSDRQTTHESPISPQTSRKMFQQAIGVLKNISMPRMFTFLHTYEIHSPYRLHRGLSFSNSIKNQLPYIYAIPQQIGGANRIFRPKEKSLIKKVINLYDAEIEYFDHWFGYFINQLKRLNLYKRSLIILFSDHGEEFFDHKGWGHGHSLYDELIRVPLIIKFPNQEFEGRRIQGNVGLIDIFPTLFDYLNIPLHSEVDGQSLLPLIQRNDQRRGKRTIISILKYLKDSDEPISHFPQKIALIYKNFKLIYNYKYTKELINFYSKSPPPPYREYELYNLKRDPHENYNLAFNQKYKKIFSRLKKAITDVKMAIIKNRGMSVPFELSKKEMEKIKTLGYFHP